MPLEKLILVFVSDNIVLWHYILPRSGASEAELFHPEQSLKALASQVQVTYLLTTSSQAAGFWV